MRHALKQRRSLTLLVNSTRLAIELGSLQDANLILMAGQYRPDRMDTVGPLADQTVEQLRGYSCFLGADGLSQDFGVSANEMQTAYLYQHLIRNAKETILLADHSKFGVPSLFRIGGFEAVSKVVTDRDPGQDWQTFFNDLGIALVTPDSIQEPSPQG
jgi:DeoR/GlpR family transcriptional regulator of sugar metabolism